MRPGILAEAGIGFCGLPSAILFRDSLWGVTMRQAVVVGLRFFAMWLCLNALGGFFFVYKVKQANGLDSSSGAGYVLGFMLALAVVIWMAAPYVAGAIVSGIRQAEPSPLSVADLVIAGCVLFGLWWLKEGVAGLTYAWLQAAMASSATGQSIYSAMDATMRSKVWYYTGESLLAAWLLARPSGVARWILGRVRNDAISD